jgi:large conductance mechanosensitive channel
MQRIEKGKRKALKIYEEFKNFAVKGNVIDLAVGVIIGSAFTKIVSSLVSDMVVPLLGIFVGRVDISSLSLSFSSRFLGSSPIVINYGGFLQAVLDFLTVALCVFFMIKVINRLHKKEEEAKAQAAAPSRTDELLEEIRDILKKQNPSGIDL